MVDLFNMCLYCILLFTTGSFIYLDGHNIVKHTATIKWKKFRKINSLVATNYSGFFKILWISICMISKAIWISIIQYMNSTIIQINGNKYLVTYVIKGKTYKMIVKPTRGPRKVLMMSDENQDEISHIVGPYLGPEENFHGEIYTPSFFGIKEIVFELSNGTEKIFSEHEDIKI